MTESSPDASHMRTSKSANNEPVPLPSEQKNTSAENLTSLVFAGMCVKYSKFDVHTAHLHNAHFAQSPSRAPRARFAVYKTLIELSATENVLHGENQLLQINII